MFEKYNKKVKILDLFGWTIPAKYECVMSGVWGSESGLKTLNWEDGSLHARIFQFLGDNNEFYLKRGIFEILYSLPFNLWCAFFF